jgi:hypothetical protein
MLRVGGLAEAAEYVVAEAAMLTCPSLVGKTPVGMPGRMVAAGSLSRLSRRSASARPEIEHEDLRLE